MGLELRPSLLLLSAYPKAQEEPRTCSACVWQEAETVLKPNWAITFIFLMHACVCAHAHLYDVGDRRQHWASFSTAFTIFFEAHSFTESGTHCFRSLTGQYTRAHTHTHPHTRTHTPHLIVNDIVLHSASLSLLTAQSLLPYSSPPNLSPHEFSSVWFRTWWKRYFYINFIPEKKWSHENVLKRIVFNKTLRIRPNSHCQIQWRIVWSKNRTSLWAWAN